MQKKIIALAVAGLVSGAAFAQSNVTIYGSIDEAYTYAKGSNVSGQSDKTFSGITGGQWNGNRVGFKGQEDLGNGLKAIFQYEFGAAAEGQGGLTSNRFSFVGLDTNFGSFTAGRQNAPSQVLMGKNSAFAVASTTALNNFTSQFGYSANQPLMLGTMSTGDQSRWNNSIAFNSKVYSGFSARAIYAFSDTVSGTDVAASATTPAYTTSVSDNGKFGISGTYANGPLNLDLIYQGQYNVTVSYPRAGVLGAGNPVSTSVAGAVSATPAYISGEGNDINEWYFGGSYDFKVVKLYGSYQALKNNNNNNISYNSDSKVWSLGVSVPVSAAGTIRAEYAQVKFSANEPASIYDGKSQGYGIGYTHDLSKRTMLYTSINYTKNDEGSFGFGGNNNINVGVAGESNTVFTSGVRHFF